MLDSLITLGKTYLTAEYWHGVPFRAAEKLPYDIDGKCMYALPINKSRRFETSRVGPWGKIHESKHIDFVGDRHVAVLLNATMTVVHTC